MAYLGLLPFAFAIISAYLVAKHVIDQRRRKRLPPGPKPLPLVGNIADLPSAGVPEWEHWLKHKDLYGPISSVTVLGQTLILIHDKEIAFELMEKRSSVHSSRPHMEFANEMYDTLRAQVPLGLTDHCRIGWKEGLGSLPYNSKLRLYRKQFHLQIGTKALVAKHYALQDVEVRRFLWRVLQKPENLWQSIQT
jgi:hypothetical protein